MGIAPMNKGFADLFVDRFFSLNLKDLNVNWFSLGTPMGPNCTQESPTAASPAKMGCLLFVR